MDIVGGEHVVSHVTLVEIDVRPLSTLGFMAGDGIGEFYLKGVIVTVRLQLLDTVSLMRNICIVLHHGIEELFLLFSSKGRCLRSERIEKYGSAELVIVIVWEGHRDLRKTEAIELVDVPDTPYDGTVAVGEERDFVYS